MFSFPITYSERANFYQSIFILLSLKTQIEKELTKMSF